ncbi:MAG: type I DNA topoisomerase [Rhodospirillales bacterium]
MNVVIVESPAKAKTINKYLGPDFTVLASYGHVRDLPAKDGSVRPDHDFSMDWEVDPRAQKHLKLIEDALKGARRLYLATDPDREGEAISWHVCQVLDSRRRLDGIDTKRVVFNEITRGAILDAFSQPRDLDQPLIEAYLARRALDYLVGFTLSPVLWRKLPGSRSAGRVQSVALRLICERETEIENFISQEFWTIEGTFRTVAGDRFQATMTHLAGRKLDKFDLPDKAAADAAVDAAVARTYTIAKVERKTTRRNPAPPFITSTLQQEAARKLGFTATQTMRTAQRLYEGVSIGGETVGLITYMRTDGVQMAADAVAACRKLIADDFGDRYLPEKPRVYKTKVKNAQEAHEAIRPTDVRRRPEDVRAYLDPDQLRLYTLIWKRTLACQMAAALIDQTAADIVANDGGIIFRATGSTVAFDGFLKVYREGRDDPDSSAQKSAEGTVGEEGERVLPDLVSGTPAEQLAVIPEQHFTQPPPRFTEASLVKRLEELGIGRPSTYASIISVLQERTYVRLEKGRFIPEDRGRLVTAFLTSFFERYVAYGFTATMEEKLDDISGGRVDWKRVLDEFWREFSVAVDGTKGLRIKEVLDALDSLLGPHFFREGETGRDPRACPTCGDGRLSLKLGKFGAFIGCSNYPACRYTRPLVPVKGDEAEVVPGGNGRSLGVDPATGQPVAIRKGPYGYYAQLGETPKEPEGEGKPKSKKPKSKEKGGDKDKENKPKRTALPRGFDPQTIGLEQAVQLLSLPREIGIHPESDLPVTAGIGRFGPYLKMGDQYVSLKGEDDVLSIGLNRAVDLFAHTPKKTSGRVIGSHPDDGKPVKVKSGRYGTYVEHGSERATLPAEQNGDTLSMEDAIALLAAKAAKAGIGGRTKSAKTVTPTKTARSATTTAGTGKAAPKRTKTGKAVGRAATSGKDTPVASAIMHEDGTAATGRRHRKASGS